MIKDCVAKESIYTLVRQIGLGDYQAEGKLITELRLLEKVTFMVRARVRASRDDHKDLISDVMMAILRNLREGKYTPEKGPIESYLAGIVRFKIVDFIKLKSRHARSELPEEHLLPEIDTRYERRDLNAALRVAIQQLDKRYQEVLILKYFQDKPVSEISECLRITRNQVYNRIHYALSILRHIAHDYL